METVTHSRTMAAVVRVLQSHAEMQPLFGSVIGAEPLAPHTPWVFQDVRGDVAPYRDPKGTGKVAVVVSARDDWGVNDHNFMQMPIVRFFIYSDVERTSHGEAVGISTAVDRAEQVYSVINDIFHDVGNRLAGTQVEVDNVAGAVTFVRSRRRDGFSLDPVMNGDGMQRLTVQYDVSTTSRMVG